MDPQEIITRNLAIGGTPNSRSLTQFSGEVGANSETVSRLNDKILSSLSSSIDQSQGNEKSILDTFAERRRLATEGGEAERDLITSRAGTSIEEAGEAGATALTTAREGRRGFATNTGVIKAVTDETAKNIRLLKKDRDELLLLGKVAQADRIDNLIFQEQESIANSRRTLLDNLLKGSAEIRSIRSFETPQQQRKRQQEIALDTAGRTAVQNLAGTAPDAGIIATDTFDQALEKYRGSETFQRDQRKGELEIQSIEAKIQQSLASADASRASIEERLSKTTSKEEEKTLRTDLENVELKEKVDLIDELIDLPGLNSRVGPSKLTRRNFAVRDSFGAGQLFAGKVQQLTNQEFIDKLISAKSKGATFGALNQSEADSLRRAATAINAWEVKDEGGIGIGEWDVKEKDFISELNKIKRLANQAVIKSGGIPNSFSLEDTAEIDDIFSARSLTQ